jgi:hypothetical protein
VDVCKSFKAGVTVAIIDEDLDVERVIVQLVLPQGIKLKSNNTSMSRSYTRWVLDL